MRTKDELIEAALEQRRKALDEGAAAEFACTPAERCLLLDQPLDWQNMLGLPEHICGLSVRVAEKP